MNDARVVNNWNGIMAGNSDAVFAMLSETPFGKGLSKEDLAKVAQIASSMQVDAPVALFQEGDQPEQLYLVVRGLVSLEMCMPRRGCSQILTVGPGEFVGWSAIVGNHEMTTRARILEPATLVVLPAGRLRALCDSDHNIGYAVMRQVAVGISRRLLATRLQLLDLFGETQPVPAPDFAPERPAGSTTKG